MKVSSPTTIGAVVSEAASSTGPAESAILAPSRRPLARAALRDRVGAVGAALARAGIGRGDGVGLVTAGGPEAAVAFLGVASHAACAPLNPAYREAELEFYLTDIEARALVVDGALDTPAASVARSMGIPVLELERIPDAEAGVFRLPGDDGGPGETAEPSDVALLLHTSGTTSRPKLVPLTHRNLLHSAGNVAATLGLTTSDRCLDPMPLFHVHGLVAGLLAPLVSGGSVACPSELDPEAFLGWLDELAPTWYTAVPTMHLAFLNRLDGASGTRRARAAGLRFLRSSSSSLPAPLMGALEDAFGAPVIEAYGMTEASHQITSNRLPPGTRKPGSVGPAGATELAVVDESGRRLQDGESGEVVIRGPTVTAGYLSPPGANDDAFLDGWFRTGDLGWIDDDGYLRLDGRLKEMINRGGEKIAPREIDDVLLGHPGVEQAVTFAIPHPTLGEEVAAAVVPRPGSLLEQGELGRFSAARLAAFKVPRRFVFLDTIPKGPTGKLRRIGLAETLGLVGEDGAALAGSRPPETGIERTLATLWGEILGVGQIGVDDDFFALGGDSLQAVTLFRRVEERWGRGISTEILVEGLTIHRLAQVLEADLEARR